MESGTFLSYYYLKEELVRFCRQEGLQASGGKVALTERISHYLDTGEKLTSAPKPRPPACEGEMTDETRIGINFVCSERHHAFFEEKIGKGFRFNVTFLKWLRSNAERTYSDAIKEYHRIAEEKKNGKTVIDKQFQYNTYIRDFFSDNKGKGLGDAIKCWRYKKGMQGHNSYERTDLIALDRPQDGS